MSERRLAGLALALLLAACTGSAPRPGGPAPSGCPGGDPLAGVHNPERMQVLDRCRHAEGITVDVAREDDGDIHIWFRPDGGYEGLLNAENHFQAQPAMLAEIVPRCQGHPTSARSSARCPPSQLPVPRLGDHVAIDGPWVLDTDHGWREIHPVDSIVIRR